MASLMMFRDCSFSTATAASRLIHWNRPNGAFLPRRCVGKLCLRTTASRRGCIRSSSADGVWIIDPITVIDESCRETRRQISRMKKSIGVVPGLAVIYFGEGRHELEEFYEGTSEFFGIKLFIVHLAEDSSEEEVLESVARLNEDPCVHGINLLDLPLPSHIDEHNICEAVSVEKDVDGVHPLNIGLLAMQGREPLFVPLAPKGCIELLHRYKLEIRGKTAVVIGGGSRSSRRFCMATALLLQREDATVTIIPSSRTNNMNPEEITRQADILISATGQPNTVRGSWIKPGAIVISVGSTSQVKDPNALSGFRVVGDMICFEEVCKVASAMTPVINASRLVTLSMLLSNVLASAQRIRNFV